jgi:DNA adenine methylase
VESLIELLEKHEKDNDQEYYYVERGKDRNSQLFSRMSDTEKAARMIYLNKTCYNGLYRVNSAGLFNVPYGRYRNPMVCEKEVLRAVSGYLSDNDIRILNGDFETAVASASRDDFVYFDPPYDRPDCTNFTGYQADGFDRDGQIRLRDTILRLTDGGVKCLLSNSSTDFIKEIYDRPEFKIEYVKAKRMISSRADGRGDVEEVLIRNW